MTQPQLSIQLPLLDYLAAAPGCEYAVTEFDHDRGNIFDGVHGSVEFLTSDEVL